MVICLPTNGDRMVCCRLLLVEFCLVKSGPHHDKLSYQAIRDDGSGKSIYSS